MIDDLVGAECADLEGALDDAKEAADRATESKRKVEERLQALTDEFGQQDAELNAAASYRRLCDERQNQIVEIELESARLREEIAGLLSSEQAAKATLADRNKLRTTVGAQKQQMLEQLEKQQTTEVALAVSIRDFELIQEAGKTHIPVHKLVRMLVHILAHIYSCAYSYELVQVACKNTFLFNPAGSCITC